MTKWDEVQQHQQRQQASSASAPRPRYQIVGRILLVVCLVGAAVWCLLTLWTR